jgi:hypothetical protein
LKQLAVICAFSVVTLFVVNGVASASTHANVAATSTPASAAAPAATPASTAASSSTFAAVLARNALLPNYFEMP